MKPATPSLVGGYLRSYRYKNFLTARDISHRMSRSRSCVSLYENATYPLEETLLEKISAAYANNDEEALLLYKNLKALRFFSKGWELSTLSPNPETVQSHLLTILRELTDTSVLMYVKHTLELPV